MMQTEIGYILVVDDEKTIREVVRRYLELEGFRVKEAEDGYQALDIVELHPPALIVLDLMLPGIDGVTLTKQIRREHRVPIIMLTARGEPVDRIQGLEVGADDYMVKPFVPQELVARVQAVLRRVNEKAFPAGPSLTFEGIQIDPAARSCVVAGEEVQLTAREFDLLWLFASQPGRVFTREQMLDHIWGAGYYGEASTVTVYIRRLREKIEKDPQNPEIIRTVWGVGYKFEA